MRRRAPLTLSALDNEQAYEAELSRCSGVTGFHHWFFLEALSEALGLRLSAYAVDVDGQRLGLVPVLLRRRGPLATANYLPVPHIGPVLRDGRLAEMLSAVDPLLRRQRVVVTKLSFAPGVKVALDELGERGFEISPMDSFVVLADQTPEEYLKALSAKQRSAIRRGQARGITAEPSTREEITDWFPRRVCDPYLRQGLAPDYSYPAACAAAERLADDPRMLWRSIHGDSGLLAVNACIIGSERLWGWVMVGERAPGPSPHVAAYWDAIQWSLARGLACDFGGAPTAGIREFKLQMGGQVEQCVVAERVRPKAYRSLRALHGRLVNRGPGDSRKE